MNCIKKMKIGQVLTTLAEGSQIDCLTDGLIDPELLVLPVEDELLSDQTTPEDRKVYEQVLKLLKSSKELSPECKGEILKLLGEIKG